MNRLSRVVRAAVPMALPCLCGFSALAGAQPNPQAARDAASPQAAASVTDPERLGERTPARLVHELREVFGAHHARAVHAKGIIVRGSFTPSTAARTLSRADLFVRTVPVIARFSNFTGLPTIPDTDPNGQPRGFAVKFLLTDGGNYDVVSHSYNGFPTATAAEFGELLQAIAASGPGAAKPTALDRYLDAHPIAKRFLTAQTPPPESYATTAYYGVNAFQFTNAAGRVRYVRYRFVPEAGEHYLNATALAGKPANYLQEEIARRIAHRPIRFTWYAQLAGPGDDIANPAVAWPHSREEVKLGVITIDRVGPNTALADKSLLFLPGTTPPGIGAADPMLTIRNAAYPVSFAERQ